MGRGTCEGRTKPGGDEGCFSPALTWGLRGASWCAEGDRGCGVGGRGWGRGHVGSAPGPHGGSSSKVEGPRCPGLWRLRAVQKRLYKWSRVCKQSFPFKEVDSMLGFPFSILGLPKKITETLRKCSWLLFGRIGEGGDSVRAFWS